MLYICNYCGEEFECEDGWAKCPHCGCSDCTEIPVE